MQRIREASRLIHEAARPLRVLGTLAWGPEVKQRFFARGAGSLPLPSYPAFDPTPPLERVREARRLFAPVGTIDLWLERQAASVEGGARMLSAIG